MGTESGLPDVEGAALQQFQPEYMHEPQMFSEDVVMAAHDDESDGFLLPDECSHELFWRQVFCASRTISGKIGL